MTRREAREELFTLLYEASFRDEGEKEDVYRLAVQKRGLEDEEYIKNAFFKIQQIYDELDGIIEESSTGWKADRISRVTMAILRLGVYEMLHCDDIPTNVSINEAVELAKKFDHEKSPKFVNGILNSVADKYNLKGN